MESKSHEGSVTSDDDHGIKNLLAVETQIEEGVEKNSQSDSVDVNYIETQINEPTNTDSVAENVNIECDVIPTTNSSFNTVKDTVFEESYFEKNGMLFPIYDYCPYF